MVSMYRNTNLEEINTDALFGIDFFMYQTVWQKALLVIGVIVSLGINIFCMFFLEINSLVAILISIPILLICILLGCNYNQDLTLIKYLLCELKDSKYRLSLKSTESIISIRNKKDMFNVSYTPEDKNFQKNLLFKRMILLGIVFGLVLIFVIIYVAMTGSDENVIHHTV